MLIKKKSQLTGIVHTREIDVTQEQLRDWEESEGFIQDALSHLSVDDREFILTGVTPEEWVEAFGYDEDKELGRGDDYGVPEEEDPFL